MSWKYFKIEEFACHHCGKNLMSSKFIDKLEELREEYDYPLVVSSGYRCSDYNKTVSTTGDAGPHTTGRAVDFLISRNEALQLLEIALSSGRFSGIGLNQKGASRFIHLDDLTNMPGQPRPTIWTY